MLRGSQAQQNIATGIKKEKDRDDEGTAKVSDVYEEPSSLCPALHTVQHAPQETITSV